MVWLLQGKHIYNPSMHLLFAIGPKVFSVARMEAVVIYTKERFCYFCSLIIQFNTYKSSNHGQVSGTQFQK